MHDLHPDLALLAAAGRGNVNGEPVQGSLAGFIASEVEMLRPRKVALCHHDNWMPPLTTATDIAPIKHELGRRVPDCVSIMIRHTSSMASRKCSCTRRLVLSNCSV